MLPWQPFLAFYIWGAHWHHLKNTTEPSMCGGDAALCQITWTTCSLCNHEYHARVTTVCYNHISATTTFLRVMSVPNFLTRRRRTDLLRMWSAHPSDDTATAMYAARRTSGSLLCNAEFTCRICQTMKWSSTWNTTRMFDVTTFLSSSFCNITQQRTHMQKCIKQVLSYSSGLLCMLSERCHKQMSFHHQWLFSRLLT